MKEEDNQEDASIEAEDEGDLELNADSLTITLSKNDRSLAEFYRWYARGRLIVDPEWQRQYVWDRKRASRLIESFLIDLPVPVIYLAVNEGGEYEVIDGLQRLTSVFDFFSNSFALRGLEIKNDLNGKYFQDLSQDVQAKLEDTTLRTFELAKTTPKDLMFIIFERLNTGGIALNDMEIRNCLYRGPLNNLLKELSAVPEFKTSVSQKNIEKRMGDRALILRFLSFYQLHYTKAKKGLKSFLNEFFDTYRHANEAKLKEFQNVFQKSARASYTVFGDKAFRLRRDNSNGGGEWSARMNASVFQVLMVSFTEYDIGQVTRSADRIKEAYLDLITTDSQWVEYVSAATGDFQRISYVFSTWQERLKAAIGDTIPNDTRRLFSRELKEEMFKQDPTCSICNNRIVTLHDAALDHHLRYWEGGQTVPENARLAHRQCNWDRAKKN